MKCSEFRGKASKRVTIEQKSVTSDSYGGQGFSWVTVATVWAYIEPLSGREAFRHEMLQSNVNSRILIRYLSSLKNIKTTAAYRISYDDRVFSIIYARNLSSNMKSEGHDYIEFYCAENESEFEAYTESTAISSQSQIGVLVAGQSLGRGLFSSQASGSRGGANQLESTLASITGQTVSAIDGSTGGSYATNISDTAGSDNYWWNSAAGDIGPAQVTCNTAVINSGQQVRYMVWAQGEADSFRIPDVTTAEQYKSALINIFNYNKLAHGITHVIIQGSPGRRTAFNNEPGVQLVRQVYSELINQYSWIVRGGESYDQPLYDAVHLSDSGYVEVGRRDALAIANIIDGTTQSLGVISGQPERVNTNRLVIPTILQAGTTYSARMAHSAINNLCLMTPDAGEEPFIKVFVNDIEVDASTIVHGNESEATGFDNKIRLNYATSVFGSGDTIDVYVGYDAMIDIDTGLAATSEQDATDDTYYKIVEDDNGLPIRLAHWRGDFDNNWTQIV